MNINKKLIKNNKYNIIIDFGLLDNKKLFIIPKEKKNIVIITNKKIYNIYFKKVYSIFLHIGIKANKFIISDKENNKSITTIKNIFTFLIKRKYNKSTILISLGGGVISDITGFVASCYSRGIEFIQIPTTFLSQIDASIGGKNAINHNWIKNIIGTIYQPKYIIIDPNTIKSLPTRHFVSGIAEIIKYGICLDYNFFCWIESNISKILKKEKQAIIYCIKYCCKIKSYISKIDERETNKKRILLNFGHTFGHAIESESKFKLWTHGEAVSIGMIMASKVSEIIANFSKKNTTRIIKLLQKANLPTNYKYKIDYKKLIKYMIMDKKSTNKNINLILTKSIGTTKLYKNINYKTILKAIKKSL